MAYLKLNSNITPLDVSKLLGKRPVSSADRVTNLKPLNILVIGSDTRALGTASSVRPQRRLGDDQTRRRLCTCLATESQQWLSVSLTTR